MCARAKKAKRERKIKIGMDTESSAHARPHLGTLCKIQ